MSVITKLTVIIIVASLTMVSGAEPGKQPRIYKFVDANGRVSFTDKPLHDGYVKLKKTRKGWVDPGDSYNYRENKKKYEDLIVAASQKHEVPFWLISAVIHAESLYNPHAVSSTGAVGLMQLMPATARSYGVSDRQNPSQNIEGGVRYLKDLMQMFNGNLELALAAYNAGENAVKKYGNRIPPYRETQLYVKRVNSLSKKYQLRII